MSETQTIAELELAYASRMAKLDAERLRTLLAQRTQTSAKDWYLVFKARQGMKCVFDAVAALEVAGSGRSEVLTQLYTCCTAVDPIVAAGLVPVYGDIDASTFALDAEKLNFGTHTAAVVLQHTFGVINVLADTALVDKAHDADALVVEDCAHCAGRMSLSAAGKPLVDVSVHSFGVEKMLPTHFGGAVWVNPEMQNTALRERIIKELAVLPDLDEARARAAKHYLNQIRLITHLPHAAAHAVRQRLEAQAKFEPAVAECELKGELAGECALPSAWVIERVVEAMANIDTNEQHRKEVVALYNRDLGSLAANYDGGQPLHKYCVLMDSAALAAQATDELNAAGIYTVSWYRPLLFPGASDEQAYALASGLEVALQALPTTKMSSECGVCLPTDISFDAAQQVVQILKNISCA